ncbi:MAG: hypothetical protein HYV97_12450 [Bdellovibrio sp.]|nr:hypothetical protein [Bdellovibrio sp.]
MNHNQGQESHILNLEELMARPSKHELKRLKCKCYLALLISNLGLFMLMFPTENQPLIKKISASPGNIILRLPLTLMLPLNQQQKNQVTLVDRAQHMQIASAWIWDDDTGDDEKMLTDIHKKFYSIEVRPSDAIHLLKYNQEEENILMAIPPIPFSQVKKEHPYVEMLL